MPIIIGTNNKFSAKCRTTNGATCELSIMGKRLLCCCCGRWGRGLYCDGVAPPPSFASLVDDDNAYAARKRLVKSIIRSCVSRSVNDTRVVVM